MHEQIFHTVQPFLEIDRQYLQRTLPDFLTQLQSYLEDPATDVTRLRLVNLSDQARSFWRTFGEISNLLGMLDDKSGAAHDFEPLEQAELLPDNYRAQAGDYYLVSVYAGRSVVQRSDGHCWEYMSEIQTPEAHTLIAPLIPLGKKGGFLFSREVSAEQEYHYPKPQPCSHMIHEERENVR